MAANYCTASASQAVGFNGYSHAAAWSGLGFTPVELPPSRAKAGEDFGLRNANGDWIADLKLWIDHDHRVLDNYRAARIADAQRLARFPDLTKDN